MEKNDFNGFAIFSIGGHLEFSTRLNFTGLKPCSLIMLHVNLENHGYSGFREKSHLNGSKSHCRGNCEWKDGRSKNRTRRQWL